MKPHVPQSAFRTPHSAFRIRHGPFAFLIALYLAHTALLIGDGQLALSRLNIRGIDPVAYYSYFHSLYFDHDLEFKNQYDRLGQGFMPDNKTPKGRTANHSSVGPAIALAPFWIGADVVARLGGWKADGTTKPYHVAAFVGLGFYGLVALLLMGLWCMRRFGRWPGAWAAALAWATSSLLYYSFPETLMPHAIGAAAAALFVLAVDSGFLPRSGVWSPAFRRNVADHGEAPEPSFRLKAGLHTQEERAMVPSTRSAALAGAALGLAMLMRWQNALYAVYPLALSFHRLLNSEERRTRARRELVYWIVFGAAALVVFSPQMIVWQILFGTPLTAPQGRGYFFLARFEALRVLFSPHNGLFVWTPGVALAVAGLFVARRADRPAALGLGLVLLAQLGVNS
ncbi:MAG: hypothetical protein NTW86_27845, partial [Candidatus Sumerlaeota bacterium]|nr:hypothetical protein [Candidatus Sumerlaeota bacterium]